MDVVASLSQVRTAAAQCGFFTYKSVPVIFEPPCSSSNSCCSGGSSRSSISSSNNSSSSSNSNKSNVLLCKFQPYPPSSHSFTFFVFQIDPLLKERSNLIYCKETHVD